MLAADILAAASPLTMADDSMEISSEHGNNDEDIDIDIDLTAGQADEDYVLEDAASYAPLEDEPHHQPSPAVGTDDVMVDEDDQSYEMNDTDTIPDDSHQSMDHEAAPMSFTMVDESEARSDQHETLGETHFVDASAREPEVMWEQNDGPNEALIETDVHLEDPEEHVDHDQADHVDDLITQEVEASTADAPQNGTQSSTPRNRSPIGAETSEPPKSPSGAHSKPADASPEDTVNKTDFGATTTSTSNEDGQALNGETEEPCPVNEPNALPAIPEISVLYHNMEYALFATSELDDPDSFFLSDVSIIEKPFANFFKAIRDVINEDLADEDELCMSMTDLGIEIEETSALTQDITLGQILTLHNKLLENDGIDSPHPFSIQFGVRPSLSKRLANLAAGAAEGKGLSELIVWDEHSDSANDSTEAAEINEGEDSNVEAYEPENNKDEAEEKAEEVHESSDTSQAPIPGEGLKSDSEAANAEALNASDRTDSHEFVAQGNAASVIQPSPKAETPGNDPATGEFDEDGDIIDYSEDEAESPHKSGNDAKSRASKLETDGTKTYNEYEAINEELRRRSISHAAGDSRLEKSAEQIADVENEDVGHEPEVENGVEYDEENGDGNYGLEDVGSEHKESFDGNDEAEHDEVEPDEVEPDEVEPDEAEHDEAEHDEAEPDEVEPDEVEPDEAEHDEAEHDEAEPDEVEPDEVRPDEVEHDEVEHAEVEPHEHYSDLDRPSLESRNGLGSEGETRNGETGYANPEEEIGFEEEDDVQAQKLFSLSGGESGIDISLKDPSGDDLAADSSLGFGDAVASESGTSEKTLEAPTGVGEAPEDEIDYDDDDEEQGTPEAHDPVSNTKELPVPLEGSGKRQREEANLDEGTSVGTKEAKRPRS